MEIVSNDEARRIAREAGVEVEDVHAALESVNHFIRIHVQSVLDCSFSFRTIGLMKKVPRGLERKKFKRNGRPRNS